MRPFPRSSLTGLRALPRSRAPLQASRPRRRTRRSWVFGAATGAEPYVFAPQPDTREPPDSSASSDPRPASADLAEPDGEPDGSGEVDARRAPAHATIPRPVKGVTARIDWREFRIERFPIFPLPRPGGGIYIIRGAEGPLYVGETASFGQRWSRRLREAFQGGLIERTLADKAIRIWFGTITPNASGEARKTLESAIIRTLRNGGLGSHLRNDRSVNEFRTLAPLDVTHVLPLELVRQLQPNHESQSSVSQAIDWVKHSNNLVIAAHNVFEVSFHEGTTTASLRDDSRAKT